MCLFYAVAIRFTERLAYDHYFNAVRDNSVGLERGSVLSEKINALLPLHAFRAYVARRGINNGKKSYDRPPLSNNIDYATTVGYDDSAPHPPRDWNWDNIFIPQTVKNVRNYYKDENNNFYWDVSKKQNSQLQ